MSPSNVVSFLILLIGLVACSLPGSKNKPGVPSNEIAGVVESSDASFYLTSLEGKFTNLTYEKTIGVPGARQLTVTACFKDKARKQDIIGHRFIVRGGDKDSQQTTNGSACIVWQEEIKYNFFADERYVEYSRDLIPQGIQKGTLKISLVINPWSDKVFSPTSAKVVNTIRAEQARDALLGTNQKEKRTIFIEGVRANIVQDKINVNKFGGRYNMDVAATMMGERYDFDNQRLPVDLISTPEIFSRIQLICVYHPAGKPPQRAVIAQLDNVKGSILNAGRVTFTGQFDLKEYCASTATLMLGVTARVKTDNPLIAPFNGVFVLGQVQYTVGMGFSLPEATFARRFMDDRSLTVEDFLADGETTYRNGTRPHLDYINATLKTISTASADRAGKLEKLKGAVVGGATPEFLQAFNVEFSSLVLEPFQYEEIKGYAKNIRRQYRGRACLQLGIDSNSVRNVDFEMTKMNGEKLMVKTQNNGCFDWMDSITFNYLAPECRMKDIHFNLKSAAYGIDRKVDVKVNPWASGASSAPVVVWFSGQDKEIPQHQCVETKSQIVIGYYYQDYYVDRFQYNIDKYLGLSHVRLSNMALIPKLKRPTYGDRRGFEDVNLPVGKYLLRYAIVDQHVSDYRNAAQLKNHVYTVHRSVISVRADGTIADLAPMETAPDAIASLGVLNQLIVEVVPLRDSAQNRDNIHESEMESLVDDDTNIEVSPHVGQLVFQSESGGFRQIPEWMGHSLVNHLEQFYKYDRAEIARQQEHFAKKENAAKLAGLTLVNYNDSNQVAQLVRDLNGYSYINLHQTTAARLGKWLVSDEFDNRDLVVFCRYFFDHVWRQKLSSGRAGYNDVFSKSATHSRILVDQCIAKVGHGLLSIVGIEKPSPISEALDIEYKYFVKNPKLKSQKVCVRNPVTGKEDCDSHIAPKVARQSLSISENFFVSKDYGVGTSHGFEAKTKAEFGGSGAGWGVSVGSATVEVQGNSRGYTKGMSFDVDALRFKIQADDVERCVSIRINPALVYKKDRLMYLWTDDSTFARSLRRDLTDGERNELLSRGILLCEGKTLGRPIEFEESYYFIRSGATRGLVADTMSSRNFKDWFTSLRGTKDFANFRSLFHNTSGTPASVEAEVDPDTETFAPIQANFARGSRALPGVFNTHRPQKF